MSDIGKTLAERGARYGDFADHAFIAQVLKAIMSGNFSGLPRENANIKKGWERLSFTQRQALEVIADKIARILNGDPNYADNWHDIAGYAKLAEDRVTPNQGTQNG